MANNFATLKAYLSQYLKPESVEVNAGPLKFKFQEGLKKDAIEVINSLKSKNVLFASMNNEIWEYVFLSLKNIQTEIITLNNGVKYRGSNELSEALDFMIEAIALYRQAYETNYIFFMRAPNRLNLGGPHLERNWPSLGIAAKDLLALRQLLYHSIKQISDFADSGEVSEWLPPETHMAKFWVNYADGRRLCEKCGFNLYYSPTEECPYCFEGTTFKLQWFGASEIMISGTFNNWNKNEWKMGQHPYGQWAYQKKLDPGKYLYKFIIDGVWTLDPENKKIETDEQGNSNSILIVD
ncbi:glycogen-binding domain-containing protein [Mucilaginibacter agri]|uniref:AMP-activated protein kinase glycogen-binding domain-containing protein n=1 Tax=Mucilaginibacter agri TaxID=2695265 RepID=A0A965ZDZ6_9SPHI|nr:glycogen-binding domain-containing protein [Mucilaginibacter agri]NCD68026.1 hypothetical protein [Mucilaginibacter agri]